MLFGMLILVVLSMGCTAGAGQKEETRAPEMTQAPEAKAPVAEAPEETPDPGPEISPTPAPIKTHGVGEAVRVQTPAIMVDSEPYDAGEITLVINSVEFTDTLSEYPEFKPKEGSLYCVMDVLVTNVGNTKVNFLYGVGYPDIKDSEGYTYPVYSGGLSWTMDLLPNEKIRGVLYSEIPKDVIDTRKLVFVADAEPRITIALN